jgi:hypothetical protein
MERVGPISGVVVRLVAAAALLSPITRPGPALARETAAKRQQKIEKQLELVRDLSQGGKDETDASTPAPDSVKQPLEELESVEKALGSPATRARSRLDGHTQFALPAPSLLAAPVAAGAPSQPARPAEPSPSAGTRLREGVTRPPVLLPVVNLKPPATLGGR